MKVFISIFIVIFVMTVSSAIAIEDNIYFSVTNKSSYTCIYINFPQDLDVNKVDEPVRSQVISNTDMSPWIDTTDSEVLVSQGMLTRKPVCFYHKGVPEGEYSFYQMNILSKELNVSKSIKGGICITKYKDVDSGDNETNSTTDICELLSRNADVYDIQFRYKAIDAKPGEIIRNSVYVTSYAKLRINLGIDSDVNTDLEPFIIASGPDNPTQMRSFKIKAPETEGDYFMLLRGNVMGCNLDLCRKTEIAKIRVSDNSQRRGFIASVVPKNINLKEASDVNLKLMITNYEDEMNFSIEAVPDDGITISPVSKTMRIDSKSFTSVDFTVSPESSIDTLYEVKFNIISENNEEHTTTARISFGELLNDAKREADDIIKNANNDEKTEKFVLERLSEWEETRKDSEYGEEILNEYDSFKKDLEKAKKGKIKDQDDNNTNNNTQNNNVNRHIRSSSDNDEEPGFNWLLLIIPLVIIIGIVVFYIIKKSKNVSEKYEYPGFDEENLGF